MYLCLCLCVSVSVCCVLCVVVVEEGGERRRGETIRTIWLLIPARASLRIAETKQLYQAHRMIGGIGNVLFSICSQIKNGKDSRVSLVNLWGQVITLRGQILVSRTDDATLRVLCCVLCVCSLCVVCVCWCAMCVCVLVCHADTFFFSHFPSLSSLPHTHPSLRVYVQNALRVHIQNVPVCTGSRLACGNTCRRGAGTHGDVLTSVPHHTTHTP